MKPSSADRFRCTRNDNGKLEKVVMIDLDDILHMRPDSKVLEKSKDTSKSRFHMKDTGVVK